MKLTKIAIVVAILITTQNLFSQKTWDVYPLKYRWSVGVTAGNLLFYGDVAEFQYPWEKDLSEFKWAYGLVFRKDITPAIYLQGQGLNGTITGIRDKYSDGVLANEQFKTDLFEYNICAKVNFYRMIINRSSRLGIYALGGVGMVHYRSQMTNTATDAVVRYVGYDNLGNKTSMVSDMVMPFGIGAGYAINKKININLDATYRYVNSDLLDSREGITDVKDIYGYTSIGIVYKLGFKERPPKPYNDGPDYIADDYNTDYNDAYDYNDDNNSQNNNENSNDLSNNSVTIESENYDYNSYTDTTSAVNNDYNNNTYNDVSDYNQNTNNQSYTDSDYSNNNTEVNSNTNTIPDYNTEVNSNTNTNYDYNTDINSNTNYSNDNSLNNNNTNYNPYTPPANNHYADGLSFKVQVAASYNKPLSTTSLAQQHSISQPINEDKIGNWYKYTVGDFKTKDEANTLRKQIGVKGAFIAPYNYGARIEQAEAQDLMYKRNSNSYASSGAFEDPKMVVSLSSDAEISKNRVYYAVQVAASKKPLTDAFIRSKFGVTGPVYQDYVDGWYKYTIGVYGGFTEANNLKQQLRSKKVEGAFVVAYHNNNRIDAQEANKIVKSGTSTSYTPNSYNSNPSGYYSTYSYNDASSVVNTTTNNRISQNKIYFTVQIAASKKSLEQSFFKSNYKIDEPIFNDTVEGWNKYSVGVFDNFKEANAYRRKMEKQNGVKGAFVAAYKDNKRIPQQDARKMLK